MDSDAELQRTQDAINSYKRNKLIQVNWDRAVGHTKLATSDTPAVVDPSIATSDDKSEGDVVYSTDHTVCKMEQADESDEMYIGGPTSPPARIQLPSYLQSIVDGQFAKVNTRRSNFKLTCQICAQYIAHHNVVCVEENAKWVADSFATDDEFNRHLKRVHMNKEDVWYCQLCLLKFNVRMDLQIHIPCCTVRKAQFTTVPNPELQAESTDIKLEPANDDIPLRPVN